MSGIPLRPMPRKHQGVWPGRTALPLLLSFFALILLHRPSLGGQDQAAPPPARISQAASNSCAEKVKALEALAAAPQSRKKKTTRFSEEEINSYLAFELKSNYHPSLRSLDLSFGDDSLKGTAIIDFDKLSMNSTRFLNKLVARLFSGVHSLTVAGKLIANAGKANFQLEEARFDSRVLPNFLVEEIITAVGNKQKPPFDPMQPSQMPFAIKKVDVRRGHILVYQ